MENNLGHVDDESGRPDAAEAREALKQLQDDGARLAARVVTPWRYHLALGVIVAAFFATVVLGGRHDDALRDELGGKTRRDG
jgi:hypothetical protein